jgi:hypothetical protein
MISKNEDSKNQTKISSRRNFFSYMKQIAAGASVAGVSLGLLNPKDVFAASTPTSTPTSMNPQAIPCDGCQVTSCRFNWGCWLQYDIWNLQQYTVTTGTAPHCITHSYSVCTDSCSVNPC